MLSKELFKQNKVCFLFKKVMEYIEVELDSAVATRTGDPNYSTLDNPVFDLGQKIYNVQAVKVLEVAIPKSYNTWTDYPDIAQYITFQDTNNDLYLLDIPPGVYTPQTFVTTFNQAVLDDFAAITTFYTSKPNALTTLTSVTLSYSETQQTFSIRVIGTGAPPASVLDVVVFLINENQQNNFFLGQNSLSGEPFTGALLDGTATFANRHRINWPTYIQVNSRYLGEITKGYNAIAPPASFDSLGNPTIIGGNGQNTPMLATVPTDKSPGEIITWQDPDPLHYLKADNLFQLTELDLYLTLGPYNRVLELNGNSFYVKLGLLVNRQLFQ
jgi:hypothetical protein